MKIFVIILLTMCCGCSFMPPRHLKQPGITDVQPAIQFISPKGEVYGRAWVIDVQGEKIFVIMNITGGIEILKMQGGFE